VDKPIFMLRSEANRSHGGNENIFFSITQANNNNNSNAHTSVVEKVVGDNMHANSRASSGADGITTTESAQNREETLGKTEWRVSFL
jgi:hypothetical protein